MAAQEEWARRWWLLACSSGKTPIGNGNDVIIREGFHRQNAAHFGKSPDFDNFVKQELKPPIVVLRS